LIRIRTVQLRLKRRDTTRAETEVLNILVKKCNIWINTYNKISVKSKKDKDNELNNIVQGFLRFYKKLKNSFERELNYVKNRRK
jgi:hypothetical protein